VDATARGGRIELRAWADGDGIVVTVSDNGTGITPAQAARLFQPYFTTKPNGTGLGLFVSHKLVADHGGAIDFTSSPGEGTVFRVRLPVVPPSPEWTVPPAVAAGPGLAPSATSS
jgi:signal transduction histidine kinase